MDKTDVVFLIFLAVIMMTGIGVIGYMIGYKAGMGEFEKCMIWGDDERN